MSIIRMETSKPKPAAKVKKNLGGRPTDKERFEKRQADERRARYEEQEAKRAKLVQIDTSLVLTVWLVGVAVAFTASAIISFNGITAVAPAVGLAFPWMAGLFFGFVEISYLLFLIAYLALESRGLRAGWALVGVGFFSLISVAANAWHTLTYHEWNVSDPQTWAGVVLSITAPIAILSMSKLASRLVFAKTLEAEQ